VVHVLVWPKQDASSGVKRMKCKAEKDGAIGWVSSLPSFVQML